MWRRSARYTRCQLRSVSQSRKAVHEILQSVVDGPRLPSNALARESHPRSKTTPPFLQTWHPRSEPSARKLSPDRGKKGCRKPDPVLGPPKLARFVPGPACCNLFSPCRVTVFWRMARYVDAKFADKELLFLNGDETRVQEHLRASAVRPQQAAAFDEQPFQFPGL